MKKILGWTAAVLVSVAGVAACGSDKKESPTTTAATATTAAGSATTAGGGSSSGSSSAQQFCNDVQAILDKGPTDPNYVTNLQKLISQGTSLISSNPADAATLQACITKLQP
jgi:hypothetical protein